MGRLSPRSVLLAVRVEPEGEEAGHTGHDHVGHQRDHDEGQDERADHGRESAIVATRR